MLRSQRVRATVAHLARDLDAAPAPGSLERALARATVDADQLRRQMGAAVARADVQGDDLASLLATAEADTLAAIAELRDLAHGIYPAVLTESGLGPALWMLTDAAPRHGTDHLTVRVRPGQDAVAIEVHGAGPGPFVHAADRVGALGGHLSVDQDVVRAVVPCG